MIKIDKNTKVADLIKQTKEEDLKEVLEAYEKFLRAEGFKDALRKFYISVFSVIESGGVLDKNRLIKIRQGLEQEEK